MPEATTSSAISAGCLAQARATGDDDRADERRSHRPHQALAIGQTAEQRDSATVSTAVVTTKSAPIAIVPQP